MVHEIFMSPAKFLPPSLSLPPLSQDHWSHAPSVSLFHSQPTSSVSLSSARLSLYLISTGPNTTAPTAHWHFSSSFPDSLWEFRSYFQAKLCQSGSSGSSPHGAIWGHQGLGAGSSAGCGQVFFQKGEGWAGLLQCHFSTKTCLSRGKVWFEGHPTA